MSLTRQFRLLIVPRLQQCLYTTGASGSDKTIKDVKTTAQAKTETQKPKTSPTPQTTKGLKADFDITTYKCNTYYEHREWTFYDIESQMSSKRVGQPSKFDKIS